MLFDVMMHLLGSFQVQLWGFAGLAPGAPSSDHGTTPDIKRCCHMHKHRQQILVLRLKPMFGSYHSMFICSPGITYQVQHDLSWHVDGKIAAIIHITIAPRRKQQFSRETGRDALQEALDCVKCHPLVLQAEVRNRAVRIVVRRLDPLQVNSSHELFETLRALQQRVQDRFSWWHQRLTDPVVPSLQHMVLERLQDQDFKLRVCINHAARHGAEATWDMLRLAEEWRHA